MRHITSRTHRTVGARLSPRGLAAPAAIALGVALAAGCGGDPTAPHPVIHGSRAVITVLPEGTIVSPSRRAAGEGMEGVIGGEFYRRGGARAEAGDATGGHGGNANAEAVGGDGGDATSGA